MAWKRPDDFEERAEEIQADGDGMETFEEAFLSGALWAALVAEERI